MGSIFRQYPDKFIIIGGKRVVTGSKTLNVEPIACKDSNQDVDLITESTIAVDISTNGLNGLDTGTVANDTTYYLYIVRSRKFRNDLPVGFLFSLSNVAPTFTDDNNLKPYDLYRRITEFKVNSSGNIEEQNLVLVIKGIVDVWADLPGTPDDVLDIWIVRNGSGIYLINRKPGGLYRWDIGSSSWVFMAEIITFFNSANFEVYDNADNTKRLKLNVSGITASTIRTITMPDQDVGLFVITDNIAMISDMITASNATYTRYGAKIIDVDSYAIANINSANFCVESGLVGTNGMSVRLWNHTDNELVTGSIISFVDAEDDTLKSADIKTYLQGKTGKISIEFQAKRDGAGNSEVDSAGLIIK